MDWRLLETNGCIVAESAFLTSLPINIDHFPFFFIHSFIRFHSNPKYTYQFATVSLRFHQQSSIKYAGLREDPHRQDHYSGGREL
ncbi:hypothetical protein L6452_26124 [Arctium lappa]|uniref:Uncharacterized protein n=1 Tax=Arctium lappa TaxID=4217 RepID=A0ACB9ACD0_ARCLA|nr:hypothetical protein L6452_26124 [Arctium lappa]